MPAGYGLGELLFTISLMPNEELTLEVKTWETSRSQQDREDTIEQNNVSDIKDLNSASSDISETREKTTNTSVNGKASYSGFGFSASIEASWSENVRDLQTQNAKETHERSQQATNEYRASHKVRMAVSREQGSESKTTRKIRNINQAHTMNVNHFGPISISSCCSPARRSRFSAPKQISMRGFWSTARRLRGKPA